MSFDAIYITRKEGRESFFYAETGGDYYTAFAALPWLQDQDDQRVDVELAMAQLVHHPEDPDCLVPYDAEEENGPFAFQVISKAQAESMHSPSFEPVSCVITLDFDGGSIRYSPNTEVPIANGMIKKELTVRMEAGLGCCQKALLDAMQPKGSGRYLDRLNQLLADRLSALAAEWEQLRGLTALYTVRNLEEERYFRTDCGGGLVNPIAVSLILEDVLSELDERNICMEADDLIRRICPSYSTYNVPTSRYGRLMFEEVDQETFRALLASMDWQEDIAEHVTLDFDERKITFRRGAWLPPGCEIECCIAFSEAEHWLNLAKTTASTSPGKDYEGTVERFLTERLLAAEGEHAQAPAAGPELT